MRKVDVLVVGAGPAGCVAAWHAAAASKQLDVLCIERDRAIGAPVRCGEAVGVAGLREFLDPAPDAPWILRRIRQVIFMSPDDTQCRVKAREDAAYILDRTRFEPVLAEEARRAGAGFAIRTEATRLERAGEGWKVRLEGPGGAEEVLAKVVIGADGIESMVGRWGGIDTRCRARDMESCAQYVVSNIAIDADAMYLQFAEKWAPHGYVWIFPRGPGVANVGLGLLASRSDGRSAREYLDAYLAHAFPGALATGLTVGGVITGVTLKRIHTDAMMLAGDAAHMINPLTGGGIVNAMKAGRLAGRHAAAALAEGDTSAARLQRYHDDWMALVGSDLHKFHRLKEAMEELDDAFYDSLARTVNKIPLARRTLPRIFAHTLVRHPSLIPVAAGFFV